MRDLIGHTLGPYRFVDKIGAGGMGEVYRAHDERLDRDVAIKVLPEKVARDPERLARFEREARAVARLSHPSILEIHDFGREGDITYAVTELLVGETLQERLARDAMDWSTAAETGASIADGLATAHRAGIVHRDLKPSNVFLTADGRVKILDFGLATAWYPEPSDVDSNESPTLTAQATAEGVLLGTAGYMSPEQVRGQKVDQRSDLFSLGCVLYEMVSGKRAFASDTSAETMTAILNEDPPALSAGGEAIPAGLVNAINRCLEKRPESRFESASDLAFSLRSLSSTSAPVPQDTSKPGLGRRIAAIALLVGALLVLAFIWLEPGDWRSRIHRSGGPAAEETTDSLAVLPFVNKGSDEDTAYLSDGIPASIIDRLSRVSGLRVVPRSTAFHFRGPNHDLADVARRLRVGSILMGEISARGETLIIRVELVDAGTDRQLWGERFTGTLDDILATEERIANRVSESLRVELSGEDRLRLARRGTSNPEAHRYYLRARYHRDRISEEHLRLAVEEYTKAIELDPDFALAYWGLSETWVLITDWGLEPLEDALPQARRAAERALAVDDELAEAHGALALVSEYEWDPVAAEREYRRALELDPDSTDVRVQWGYFSALQYSIDDGLAEVRAVLEADPLSVRANRNLVEYLFVAGSYREALEQAEFALTLQPEDHLLTLYRGRILAGQGSFDAALAEIQRADELEQTQLKYLGWTLARAGRSDDARSVLDELNRLARDRFVSPAVFALVHAGLGETDRTFELLDRALAERDPELIYLKYYPEWEPIRDDPRFDELISRIPYFIQD